MRALDARCADPLSACSKSTVAQMRQWYAWSKSAYMNNSILWGYSNIVRCLLEAGVSANVRAGEQQKPALVTAAIEGSATIVRMLLEAGADHSLTDRTGFTAVNAATTLGCLDCIELLIAAGADADKIDTFGNTALHNAILCKQTECARALLPVSDLRLTTRQGLSAMHVAVNTANQPCFELLLPLVADLDARSVKGADDSFPVFHKSALHFACERGQQQMAKALLKRGADRLALDSMQRTALHWAAQNGNTSCVVLLVGRPLKVKMTAAQVDLVDLRGCTALHCAAENGCASTCGVLIQAGARLDAEMPSGSTPLEHAQHFHPTNAALLALLSGAGPAALPGTVCDHCGKSASVSSLKGCAQCHDARYCDAVCQKAAWPGHKAACKARRAELEEKTKASSTIVPSPAAPTECGIS